MSAELYDGSPVRVLSSMLEGGLGPGQVGLVVSRPGVGKSAMLVHIALEVLLGDGQVLHVAIRDRVEHARAHYDEMFRAIAARNIDRDWAGAMVRAERHRMIHSYLDKRFDLGLVQRALVMLHEVAQFRPNLLVFDGLDAAGLARHGDGIAALARKLEVPVWVSVVSSAGALDTASRGLCDVCLRLTPDGRDVRMTILRGSDGPEPLSPALDPTSMLLRGDDTGSGGILSKRARECTQYSGGARGAEAAFGAAAERYGVQEVNFTFDGHRQERSRGSQPLTQRELAAGDVSLVYVSRRLNRTYSTEGGLIRKVLQSLWHMVSRSQQVFVVGRIQDDGTVVGGTGWSVELARMWNKDLWVFDQDHDSWHRWEGDAWVAGEPVINSVHFTGTGTRYLTDPGRAAIDALFDRSFGG